MYETFKGTFDIGGIYCRIRAEFTNGRIYGELSMACSNKKHNFEFKPTFERRIVNFEKEFKRLYFRKSFDQNKKLTM